MKTINFLQKDEFEVMYDEEVENVTLKSNVNVKYIVENDDVDSCFIGCIYEDGTCSIVGCGIDHFCSYDEMINTILEN